MALVFVVQINYLFAVAFNRPRSIYQYNLAPGLSGQNCKFLNFFWSANFQKRLG